MSPILYLVIPIAIAAIAAAIMSTINLSEAHSKINGMEGKIRELEGQRHAALRERDKAIGERDEWKSSWDQCALRLGVRIGELSEANRRSDRLKAENESLVASVNYWKNATKATP